MSSNYPEHDKLHKVADISQEIGEFIDVGLPKMGMEIYELVTRDCDCPHCREGRGEITAWHDKGEKATIVNGAVQITEWVPTHKSAQAILATYFDIDLKKIDAEKDAMLAELRGGLAK